MITYRATLDVRRELVQFVAKLLAAERRRRGTPRGSRALTCFWQAVADLTDLASVRDRTTLDRYLKDEVAARFAEPMDQLARQLRGLGVDAATLAVNVKTDLPAGIGLVGQPP